MARPNKQGLDYWPMDVNFLKDVKVRKIKKACGPSSLAVLISLLSNIYCDYGYFVVWDSDMSFLIADEVGISEGAVIEVVNKALQVDFFNKELFDAYNILTSNGIQKRFFIASERRKLIEVIEKYCLIDISKLNNSLVNLVNVDINSVNDNINSINVYNNQQSKEKKIESKEKNKNIFVETGVSTPSKKSKKTFEQDSIEYKSSKYLADKILEKSPNARVPRDYKDLLKWCEHIDYILRLDNRPVEEFRKVLAFAVNDSFWSTTILSTKKLREKYDQLFMQMSRGKGNENGDADKQTNIRALESTRRENDLSNIDGKLTGKWANV